MPAAVVLGSTPPSMVFIGDSITHGWENVGRPVWDQAFGKYHPLSLEYGGDKTENVLWRLQNGEVDGIAPVGGESEQEHGCNFSV